MGAIVPTNRNTDLGTNEPTNGNTIGCANLRAYLGTYESTHGSPIHCTFK